MENSTCLNSPANSKELNSSHTSENASPTPVALRTRSQMEISYLDAVKAGKCKLCTASFNQTNLLKAHIEQHRPTKKRSKALQAIIDLSSDGPEITETPQAARAPSASQSRLFSQLSSDSPSIPLAPSTTMDFPESPPLPAGIPELVEDLVKTACVLNQEPLTPPLRTNTPSSPLSVSVIRNSPMSSPDAYRISPISQDGSLSSLGSPQDSLLLSTGLTLNWLPEILSPIPSPAKPTSPDILELILTQPPVLSDSSPETISSDPPTAPKLPATSLLRQFDSPLKSTSTHAKNSNSLTAIAIIPSQRSKISVQPPFISYAEAASSGFCKMCSTTVSPLHLMDHLSSHRPCTKRFKCIKACQIALKSRPPTIGHSRSLSSNKSVPSQLELTFREKFPELPVFQQSSESSSSPASSPDKMELLNKMDSPPSGPPTASAFSKPLFSTVVRKGLFRCRFCEVPFVSKTGLESHILKVHKIPSIKKETKLFPLPSALPTCRTCFHEVEPGLSLADHCKIYHNLEISSNRTVPSTSIVKLASTVSPPPSTRTVKTSSLSQSNSLKISVKPASLPQPPDFCPSRTFLNSNLLLQSRSFKPKVATEDFVPSAPAPHNIKNSIPSSKMIISNASSAPAISIFPKKCPHCSFVAIKKIGLRLHLFQMHNIKMNASTEKEVQSTDSSSPSSSPGNSPTGPIQAEVHQERSNPTSLVPSHCSLCSFSSTRQGVLRSHFIRVHQRPFSSVTSTSHDDKICALPSSNPAPGITTSPINIKASSKPPPRTLDSALGPSEPNHHQALHSPSSISSQDDFTTARSLPAIQQVTSPNTASIPNPVTYHNSSLKYSFPLHPRLNCPILGCNASFGTKHWFHTNASIKKHLTVFHNNKPAKVIFWCSICSSTISKNPANHKCLIGNLISSSTPIDDSLWNCHLCTFSANNPIAKRNHLAAHKRDSFKQKASSLKIPVPSRLNKTKRMKRITDLSEGPPGDLPLAPPLQSNAINLDTNDHIAEMPSIDIQRPIIIDSFLEPLNTILDVDDLEEAAGQFQNLMISLTKAMQDHFHLSPPSGIAKKGQVKPFDGQNAQKVQRLYRWNRRRCIRNLINSNSSRCPASQENIHSYFQNCWSAPNRNFSLPIASPPDLPSIVDVLSPEAVSSCLHGCENSAPGPDLLTYQHWREADPKGIILSRIFNICLKLKDIPQVWKLSNCILLPKKGDPSALENWRPISLSNTVYKLFSKCLTRKLQDWCEMNNIISRCQKGFTPYDGVVEHNFIIGQHLENARRSHTNAFLIWLDISNAFGSISHEVLFASLENAGADTDFIHLIRNIYHNSSTRIITEEGLTEAIPLSCGVKQGCPLSGPLFNLAINHILTSLQENEDQHS
ncbi:transposon TX1 uncharacterized 149 kDa protein, partial [Nephila pilipes]